MGKITSITQSTIREFKDQVIGDSILEDSIIFINSNLDPEEVFDCEKLEDWAYSNGFIKEEEED